MGVLPSDDLGQLCRVDLVDQLPVSKLHGPDFQHHLLHAIRNLLVVLDHPDFVERVYAVYDLLDVDAISMARHIAAQALNRVLGLVHEHGQGKAL